MKIGSQASLSPGLSLVAALAVGSIGCTQIFGFDKEYVQGGAGGGGVTTSSGGGGTGGSVTTGGTTTGGTTSSCSTGCPDCNVSADCPDPGECSSVFCEDHVCVPHPVGLGTACTVGGKVCDGAGKCVQCNGPEECNGSVCSQGVCTSCADNKQNGDETDVDCGGSCGSCAAGKACAVDMDCKSMSCVDTVCQPTCADGVKNQTETDVDCGGGGGCPACAQGKACMSAMDCATAFCNAAKACGPATCADGMQQMGETDVDCGGVTGCNKCAAGKKCAADTDCTSGVCAMMICM